jgi:membrane protease subunit (stomatin/prohibitin family)
LTAVLVALMALGLVAAVGYPLWNGVKVDALPVAAAELVTQDGVVYADPQELALDRALGRVRGEAKAATKAPLGIEEELERQVAALRRQQAAPTAAAETASRPAATSAGSCPQCEQPYDAGDRFCVRCGASLVLACPNCGRPYNQGDQFCARCGQKLQAEVSNG